MKKFSPPQRKEVSFPTPHTPHPTPPFKSGVESWGFMKFPHFPYPLSVPRSAVPAFAKMVRSSRAGGQEFVKRFQPYRDY